MADIFEKVTGLNLQGDTHESQLRYQLVVAAVTFGLGFVFLPFSGALWVVTAIKLFHAWEMKKTIDQEKAAAAVAENAGKPTKPQG